MSVSDPIADLLARIKNAGERNKETIEVPTSKALVEIVKIIKRHGFVEDFEVVSDDNNSLAQDTLKITLSYEDKDKPRITGAKRVSRPSVRKYRGYKEIKPVMNGLGIGIYTTSNGYKDNQQMVDEKIGGEYICEIW